MKPTNYKLAVLRSKKLHLESTIAALKASKEFTTEEKTTLLEVYETRLEKYVAAIALELDVIDIYHV